MERVVVRVDGDDPSPRELMGYFAELFREMDARPREMLVTVWTKNDRGARFTIDLEAGEPVFRREGMNAAHAAFRGRYLAEHPVPYTLPLHRAARFILRPASGNRVRVSLSLRTRLGF